VTSDLARSRGYDVYSSSYEYVELKHHEDDIKIEGGYFQATLKLANKEKATSEEIISAIEDFQEENRE